MIKQFKPRTTPKAQQKPKNPMENDKYRFTAAGEQTYLDRVLLTGLCNALIKKGVIKKDDIVKEMVSYRDRYDAKCVYDGKLGFFIKELKEPKDSKDDK